MRKLMKSKFKNIIFLPLSLFRQFIQNISVYIGSLTTKNFVHSSKKIRTFKEGDLKRILEIYRSSFKNKNFDQIIKYSKLFKNIFYIYELDGIIIGYLGYYVYLKLIDLQIIRVATLYSIAVENAFQGMGFADLLLKESLREMQNNHISSITLYVDIKNGDAINLYKNNGFKIINTLKDICGNGKDCYQMYLDIK